MHKSLALLATIAVVGTQAYMTSDARQRLNNDFTLHTLEVEEVRAKHGMRPLQYHHASHKNALKATPDVEECSIDVF